MKGEMVRRIFKIALSLLFLDGVTSATYSNYPGLSVVSSSNTYVFFACQRALSAYDLSGIASPHNTVQVQMYYSLRPGSGQTWLLRSEFTFRQCWKLSCGRFTTSTTYGFIVAIARAGRLEYAYAQKSEIVCSVGGWTRLRYKWFG